jgi:hypothetical protein
MADVEVEVQIAEYLTVSVKDNVSTEFVDSEGRRQASSGLRKAGRPHDVVARVSHSDGRKCFVRGRTKAGRQLVMRLKAA